MSYLVLARKCRPQHFNEVIGQKSVVRILQNGLKLNRVSHGMLFSGVRGVGKTTLARIMAKALNCQSDEIAKRPCNACDSCREITNGSAIDLHEIDGASNRGIQEIRELKENIRFFPTRSRYKIIIIDEVHMLTTEAFNALLKTLEEPPEHVFFMFATTEIHKIPITILSRCQRYELKRVEFSELADFFRKIADQEGVTLSDRVLSVITREADGSVRDGLSLLDQMFSFSGKEVKDEDVVQVLGLVDHTVFEKMAESLLAADLAQSLELLDQTYRVGIDLKRFANDLLNYFRTLLVCKTCPQPGDLLDISDLELEAAKKIAVSQNAGTLYQYFQFLLKGIEEMQYSPRPRLALEMAFIKASQVGQIVPAASLLQRFDDLLKQSGGVFPVPVVSPPPEKVKRVRLEPVVALPVDSVKMETNEANSGGSRDQGDKKVKVQTQIRVDDAPKKAVKQSAAVSSPVRQRDQIPLTSSTHQKDVKKNWDSFAAYVKDRKPWMAHVLQLCDKVEEGDEGLVMTFAGALDCTVLQQGDNMKFLTRYAQDFFQKELKLVLRIRGGEDETAGNGDNSIREERRTLANDPLVRMTTEVFGGRVVSVRTGPRFR